MARQAVGFKSVFQTIKKKKTSIGGNRPNDKDCIHE